MGLFPRGLYQLHSGGYSVWRVDCDALTDADLETVATLIYRRLPWPFGSVEGVPRGGLRLADAMQPYRQSHSRNHLIVDDVLTTGASLEEARRLYTGSGSYLPGAQVMGAVIFARSDPPRWVTPLWLLSSPLRSETQPYATGANSAPTTYCP